MKFHQVLILICLIGVEAKGKHNGIKEGYKGGKTQKSRGSRSLLADEPAAGRELLSDDVNHGAVAQTPSKYGHLGLNPEGGRANLLGAAMTGPNGQQAVFSGAAQPRTSSGLGNNTYGSVSKVKRSSSEAQPKSVVEIRSQGSQQQGAHYGLNQQSPSFGGAFGQGGPYGAPPGLSNVQPQPSGPGQPGSYPGQGGQYGSPYGQGIVQGQYPTYGQPIGYHHPGIAGGPGPGQVGQFGGPYGQGIPAQQSVYGQPPNYYGSPQGQGVHSGAQYGQSGGQGQFGQPGSYYGQPPQDGQYHGQPTNYYGSAPATNIPGQGGPHGGYPPWGSSVGTPGALGHPGYLNPVGSPPQAGQNPCPPGFGTLPGDVQCLPYCANGESVGCVPPNPYQPYGLMPGPYGGMEKAIPSNPYSPGYSGPIHALSRYIAGGFYYPPPQHLNSNPNVWDPAARYYFALDGGELPKDASRPPLPNPPPPSANSFPITYSQI